MRSKGCAAKNTRITTNDSFATCYGIGVKNALEYEAVDVELTPSRLAMCKGKDDPCNGTNPRALCEDHCGGYAAHCARISWISCCYGWQLKYQCTDKESFGLNNDDDLRMICDGYNDCSNGLDEMNCSNRFYCQDGQKSVYISQVTLKYLLLNKFLNYQK